MKAEQVDKALSYFSEKAICQFSYSIRRHPGIIPGRLQ